MMVASHDKIMWAPFKFEENKEAPAVEEDKENSDDKLPRQASDDHSMDLS